MYLAKERLKSIPTIKRKGKKELKVTFSNHSSIKLSKSKKQWDIKEKGLKFKTKKLMITMLMMNKSRLKKRWI
jgi:hypothetical protein